MEQNCSSNIVCAIIAAATQQLRLGCGNAGTLLNLESFLPGVSNDRTPFSKHLRCTYCAPALRSSPASGAQLPSVFALAGSTVNQSGLQDNFSADGISYSLPLSSMVGIHQYNGMHW